MTRSSNRKRHRVLSVVPAVDAIDWRNAGVFAHAPACCVVRTAAAGADVSDCCTAGVIARVSSPCAARDRCTRRNPRP